MCSLESVDESGGIIIVLAEMKVIKSDHLDLEVARGLETEI